MPETLNGQNDTSAYTERKRALIVDDDDDIRDVISDVLRMINFDVVTANSAQAGLTITATDTNFDLIIVDYKLPGKTGGELVQAIRHQQPRLLKTATLLLSGDSDIMEKASKYNISGFLPKPPDLDSLIKEVRNLVP